MRKQLVLRLHEPRSEGPTIEKALLGLVAVRARGTTKSPLDAERRDRRLEQAKVRVKSLVIMIVLKFSS